MKIKKVFLDLVFPQKCLFCSKKGEIVCQDCLSLVEINPFIYCPFCWQANRLLKPGKCPSHQKKFLDGIFSASEYRNPLVKEMIVKFKYPPYLKIISSHLTNLIIAHILSLNNQVIPKEKNNCLLMPVPLFENKEKERGFNQSALIAKHLSDYFALPLCQNELIKIKKTPSQTKLNLKERQSNIENAFVLKSETVKNKIVFLVDDVFTTGATMEEAAKTLKKSGAKKVWGLVVAREAMG